MCEFADKFLNAFSYQMWHLAETPQFLRICLVASLIIGLVCGQKTGKRGKF